MRRQVADRDGPRRGRPFERLRDPRVQAQAPAGRQLVDDRLPHQRVREAEAIQDPGGTDKPRPLGGLERVQSGLEIDLDHVGEHVGIELRAGHRRGGQHVGLSRRAAGPAASARRRAPAG